MTVSRAGEIIADSTCASAAPKRVARTQELAPTPGNHTARCGLGAAVWVNATAPCVCLPGRNGSSALDFANRTCTGPMDVWRACSPSMTRRLCGAYGGPDPVEISIGELSPAPQQTQDLCTISVNVSPAGVVGTPHWVVCPANYAVLRACTEQEIGMYCPESEGCMVSCPGGGGGPCRPFGACSVRRQPTDAFDCLGCPNSRNVVNCSILLRQEPEGVVAVTDRCVRNCTGSDSFEGSSCETPIVRACDTDVALSACGPDSSMWSSCTVTGFDAPVCTCSGTAGPVQLGVTVTSVSRPGFAPTVTYSDVEYHGACAGVLMNATGTDIVEYGGPYATAAVLRCLPRHDPRVVWRFGSEDTENATNVTSAQRMCIVVSATCMPGGRMDPQPESGDPRAIRRPCGVRYASVLNDTDAFLLQLCGGADRTLAVRGTIVYNSTTGAATAATSLACTCREGWYIGPNFQCELPYYDRVCSAQELASWTSVVSGQGVAGAACRTATNCRVMCYPRGETYPGDGGPPIFVSDAEFCFGFRSIGGCAGSSEGGSAFSQCTPETATLLCGKFGASCTAQCTNSIYYVRVEAGVGINDTILSPRVKQTCVPSSAVCTCQTAYPNYYRDAEGRPCGRSYDIVPCEPGTAEAMKFCGTTGLACTKRCRRPSMALGTQLQTLQDTSARECYQAHSCVCGGDLPSPALLVDRDTDDYRGTPGGAYYTTCNNVITTRCAVSATGVSLPVGLACGPLTATERIDDEGNFICICVEGGVDAVSDDGDVVPCGAYRRPCEDKDVRANCPTQGTCTLRCNTNTPPDCTFEKGSCAPLPVIPQEGTLSRICFSAGLLRGATVVSCALDCSATAARTCRELILLGDPNAVQCVKSPDAPALNTDISVTGASTQWDYCMRDSTPGCRAARVEDISSDRICTEIVVGATTRRDCTETERQTHCGDPALVTGCQMSVHGRFAVFVPESCTCVAWAVTRPRRVVDASMAPHLATDLYQNNVTGVMPPCSPITGVILNVEGTCTGLCGSRTAACRYRMFLVPWFLLHSPGFQTTTVTCDRFTTPTTFTYAQLIARDLFILRAAMKYNASTWGTDVLESYARSMCWLGRVQATTTAMIYYVPECGCETHDPSSLGSIAKANGAAPATLRWTGGLQSTWPPAASTSIFTFRENWGAELVTPFFIPGRDGVSSPYRETIPRFPMPSCVVLDTPEVRARKYGGPCPLGENGLCCGGTMEHKFGMRDAEVGFDPNFITSTAVWPMSPASAVRELDTTGKYYFPIKTSQMFASNNGVRGLFPSPTFSMPLPDRPPPAYPGIDRRIECRMIPYGPPNQREANTDKLGTVRVNCVAQPIVAVSEGGYASDWVRPSTAGLDSAFSTADVNFMWLQHPYSGVPRNGPACVGHWSLQDEINLGREFADIAQRELFTPRLNSFSAPVEFTDTTVLFDDIVGTASVGTIVAVSAAGMCSRFPGRVYLGQQTRPWGLPRTLRRGVVSATLLCSLPSASTANQTLLSSIHLGGLPHSTATHLACTVDPVIFSGTGQQTTAFKCFPVRDRSTGNVTQTSAGVLPVRPWPFHFSASPYATNDSGATTPSARPVVRAHCRHYDYPWGSVRNANSAPADYIYRTDIAPEGFRTTCEDVSVPRGQCAILGLSGPNCEFRSPADSGFYDVYFDGLCDSVTPRAPAVTRDVCCASVTRKCSIPPGWTGRHGCVNGFANATTGVCVCDDNWAVVNRNQVSRDADANRCLLHACMGPYIPGVPITRNTKMCNGRGVCIGSTCQCVEGWVGDFCDVPSQWNCPPNNATTILEATRASWRLGDALGSDTILSPNFWGVDGRNATVENLLPCGGRGLPTSNAQGLCVCKCFAGVYGTWSGPSCTVLNFTRPADAIACAANGGSIAVLLDGNAARSGSIGLSTFVMPLDAYCKCPFAPGSARHSLRTGLNCEITRCPVGPNGQICSGRGRCTLSANPAEDVDSQVSVAPVCQQLATAEAVCGEIDDNCRLAIATRQLEIPLLCGNTTRYTGCACEHDRHAYCVDSPNVDMSFPPSCGYTEPPDLASATAIHRAAHIAEKCIMIGDGEFVAFECACPPNTGDGPLCGGDVCRARQTALIPTLFTSEIFSLTLFPTNQTCNGEPSLLVGDAGCACQCRKRVGEFEDLRVGDYCQHNVTAECGAFNAFDGEWAMCSNDRTATCECNGTYTEVGGCTGDWGCVNCVFGKTGRRCEETACVLDCGQNGDCTFHPETGRQECTCRQIPCTGDSTCPSWRRAQPNNASSPCTVNPCTTLNATLTPDGCRCANRAMTVASNCTRLACPETAAGEVCGVPYASRRADPLLARNCVNASRCSTTNRKCETSGSCSCNEAFYSTVDGLCVPHCHPENTETIDIRRPVGDGCVCKTGWTTASQCSLRTCDFDLILDDLARSTARSVGGACSCPPPFLPDCTGHVCQNGGSPERTAAGTVSCQCPFGWTGDFCTGVAPNVCDFSRMPPAAVPVASVVNSECVCPAPFALDCSRHLCQNGGAAVTVNNVSACVCTDEFRGALCETEVYDTQPALGPPQANASNSTTGPAYDGPNDAPSRLFPDGPVTVAPVPIGVVCANGGVVDTTTNTTCDCSTSPPEFFGPTCEWLACNDVGAKRVCPGGTATCVCECDESGPWRNDPNNGGNCTLPACGRNFIANGTECVCDREGYAIIDNLCVRTSCPLNSAFAEHLGACACVAPWSGPTCQVNALRESGIEGPITPTSPPAQAAPEPNPDPAPCGQIGCESEWVPEGITTLTPHAGDGGSDLFELDPILFRPPKSTPRSTSDSSVFIGLVVGAAVVCGVGVVYWLWPRPKRSVAAVRYTRARA